MSSLEGMTSVILQPAKAKLQERMSSLKAMTSVNIKKCSKDNLTASKKETK